MLPPPFRSQYSLLRVHLPNKRRQDILFVFHELPTQKSVYRTPTSLPYMFHPSSKPLSLHLGGGNKSWRADQHCLSDKGWPTYNENQEKIDTSSSSSEDDTDTGESNVLEEWPDGEVHVLAGNKSGRADRHSSAESSEDWTDSNKESDILSLSPTPDAFGHHVITYSSLITAPRKLSPAANKAGRDEAQDPVPRLSPLIAPPFRNRRLLHLPYGLRHVTRYQGALEHKVRKYRRRLNRWKFTNICRSPSLFNAA